MDYIPLGLRLPSWKDAKTPRAIRTRKKQVCNHCSKDIDIGDIAVVCWIIEPYHNPESQGGRWHNKSTISYKAYMHEKCAEDSDEELEVYY